MSTTTSERPVRGAARKAHRRARDVPTSRHVTGAGYKAIDNGTMPVEPIKVGGQWKFRSADVDRVVDGPENKTPRAKTRRPRRRAPGSAEVSPTSSSRSY